MNKSDDGVGGEEGTFCLCTLWCVEALTRAGEYEKPLLRRAVEMFEVFLFCIYQASADGVKDFLLYLNHVGLCTEEISEAGDACVKSHFFLLSYGGSIHASKTWKCSPGVHVRSHTFMFLTSADILRRHVTLISAAYNLSRTLGNQRSG